MRRRPKHRTTTSTTGGRILPGLTCVLGALLLASCSSGGGDIRSAAGTPVAEESAAVTAEARAVPGAPPCEGFPPAGERGLPCLGPGPAVDLAGLPGPILVSVWASWCEPCRAELPVLQQWARKGGAILGVNAGDDPDAAAALLEELQVTFPSVQDVESRTRVDLGWVGPPLNVIIVDGVVVYRFDQPITTVEQIRRGVARATGKSTDDQ